MNTGAPFPELLVARERVLHFQRKLHEWASEDAERRFHDLWNLVCDPATLVVAWSRVSRNRGSRTAEVDADSRRHIEARGVANQQRGHRVHDLLLALDLRIFRRDRTRAFQEKAV